MKEKIHCLIIAGEKSGEEHALTFLPKLRELCGERVHFFGVGGDEMRDQHHVELLYHLNDFSSWGLSEVLAKIPFYIKALHRLQQEVEKRQVRVAILIDFQDFNFRLARALKKRGVDVLYYVAPQAWAWREWRAFVLGQTVHTLFTIIPFEKEWFLKRGVARIKAIPHPALVRVQEEVLQRGLEQEYATLFQKRLQRRNNNQRSFKILLLPGSRTHEVKNLLPDFLQVVLKLKHSYGIGVSVSIVKSPTVAAHHYAIAAGIIGYEDEYTSSDLLQAMFKADLCLASSGTVTLTAAIMGLPTVVCYKVSMLTELVFNHWVGYEGAVSLPNIVLGKMVFPELLQERATAVNMHTHLEQWICHEEKRLNIVKELKSLHALLQGDDFSLPSYLGDVIMEKRSE
ncbi:MAG: lipid-A-disaccharide synthase [Oligoflexia bacterium]|nr:lipid-A-disaccharide synthase [Oligoflexia bacterium]MBF0366010.1 lipid-A-disaccharide synthase [Oligoflexia bacterium]